MKTEGIVIRGKHVLLAQYDEGWMLPRGDIQYGESPEEACIRIVKEVTGYHVRILEFLNDHDSYNFIFLTEIIGGSVALDSLHFENQDIISIGWAALYDRANFNARLLPLMERVESLAIN